MRAVPFSRGFERVLSAFIAMHANYKENGSRGEQNKKDFPLVFNFLRRTNRESGGVRNFGAHQNALFPFPSPRHFSVFQRESRILCNSQLIGPTVQNVLSADPSSSAHHQEVIAVIISKVGCSCCVLGAIKR